MISRKLSRRSFIRDLTRTRHMTAVSAVVLATTFMPLLGMPEMYEVRAFQTAVDALSASDAPARNDEAARERSARAIQQHRHASRRSGAPAPAEQRAAPELASEPVKQSSSEPLSSPEQALLPLAGEEDALPELEPVDSGRAATPAPDEERENAAPSETEPTEPAEPGEPEPAQSAPN